MTLVSSKLAILEDAGFVYCLYIYHGLGNMAQSLSQNVDTSTKSLTEKLNRCHNPQSSDDRWFWGPVVAPEPYLIYLLFPSHLQGLQRRIVVTIVHESGGAIEWKDVCELVVGKI